jgi:GH43 family beta-xylosidase
MSVRYLCGVLALCAMAAAGAGPSPAAAQAVFTNPVLSDARGVADPFILKWNGEYYLYTTGDPIRAYHSVDLVTWDEVGPVLSSSDDPGAWNQVDVWAPEVVYRNGTFYLYYSASRGSDDWRVTEEARRVGVATSRSPRGPFVDSGSPVTPGWGIDGHVFRDPRTGRDYLFYSYLYEPDLPGAGQVVDSLVSPFRTGHTPTHVIRGSEAWEDKDGDPNNGSLRYTNEAPTVLERDGLYYMLYSGGSWDLPTYALAYAVSDEVVPSGGLDSEGWDKVTPPILRANDRVQGPGHNTVTLAPNNVHHITAYHGRSVPFRSPGDRQTFLDRLYWNGARPFLEPATLGARPAPDRPILADRFDRSGAGLGPAWEVVSGSWRTRDGAAEGTGLAVAALEPLRHYVFEANVRAEDGSAGVVAWYRDADDRFLVRLDPSTRTLHSAGAAAGAALEEIRTPLPPGFRFDVWHQLLVVRDGPRYEILLDGVRMQRRDGPGGPGRPGLVAETGSAAFDGVAVTAHFRDGFDDPRTDWQPGSGTWLVDESALHQVAGGSAIHTALKGDPARDYEFTASLRWRDNVSEASRAGVVAAADGRGMVVAGFDRTIWPYARFHVRYLDAGQVRDTLSVGIPRGFLYDAYHTIRVVKQGGDFTFYLDGREIAAGRFPLDVARPGLYTEGARAAFDDVAMTRLGVPRNRVLNGSFETERWPQGDGAVRAPWELTGSAEVVECCAYEGTHRLLLTDGDGTARQTIPDLPPGRYTLLAWTIARGGEASIRVSPGDPDVRVRPATGGSWQRVEIPFDLPEAGPVEISIRATLNGDPDAYVAVDNLYLVGP